MAAGQITDFKLYNDEFQGGMIEAESMNLNLFNASGSGAIRLISQKTKGQYEKEAFFKGITDAVTRRDLTSLAAVESKKLEQGELVKVKVARKFGPIEQVLEGFKMQGEDPQRQMSFVLGKLYREAQLKDQVKTAIMTLVAALGGVAGLVYDGTAVTMSHTVLANGLAKMGDRADAVRALIMHSKTYFDLVKQSVADKVVEVAGVTIMKGTVATYNRPVVIIDSTDLISEADSNGDYTYKVLGLVQYAAIVGAEPDETFAAQLALGGEQITILTQGEFSYTIGLKGFAWDISHGGANPLDAALATASNWDQAAASVKDLPGFLINVQ